MNRQERILTIFIVVSLVGLIMLIGSVVQQKTKEDQNQVDGQSQNLTGVNDTSLPLTVADDFKISVFANNLTSPRDILEDGEGDILFSDNGEGKVFALKDNNNDGKSDEKVEVVSGLNRPHGIAFHPNDNKKIYIAETNQVAVYDYDSNSKKATGKRKIADLPTGSGHFTRSLHFLPNTAKLLVSVGSSCNICNESDDRRAKVLVMNDDGSGLGTYASGLRNAVFMSEGPEGKVWVTEMGRDFLGDDLPPDELNILSQGANYGWPICYGKNIPDPFGGTEISCRDKTESSVDLPAHSAPLGLAFLNQDRFPEEMRNDLIVAYHGSWNRSEPTGYKLARIKLNNKNEFEGEEDFITGWLRSRRVLGRPVDIYLSKVGKIYVSDDQRGEIYLIEYVK